MIGRFINADSQINNGVLGGNLFAYCGNNPVMRMDDSGEGWWVIACAVIGGIIGAVAKVVSNVLTGQRWNDGVSGAAAGGATACAVFAATGNSTVVAYAGAFVESTVNESLSYIPKRNSKTSTKKATYENISVSIKKIIQETLLMGKTGLIISVLFV